jgi:uncharacterized delta-60 repeat protein
VKGHDVVVSTIVNNSFNQAPLLTSGGGSGMATTDFGSLSAQARSVVVQADGKIVVDGYTQDAQKGGGYISELVRYNADGSIDTTFGIGGIVSSGPGFATGSGVAIQAGGRIVTSGAVFGSPNHFALARYDSNGSIDTSFGTGGKVVTDFGSTVPFGLLIQPNGKIVLAGGANGSLDFGVARFNTDGSFDASFGTGGKVTTNFGGTSAAGYGVARAPDGKIVVAGIKEFVGAGFDYDFAVARYNDDGSLDTTFGVGGKVTTDFASTDDIPYSVAVQTDGKIVVSGITDPGAAANFGLVRYNVDGSLDASFGTGGKVATDFGANFEAGNGVTIQADGKIVDAGFSFLGSFNVDFALARYNSDGSLDTSFGTGGKVTTAFGLNNEEAISVVVQPDGKIVVAGSTSAGPGTGADYAVVRYNSDGSLDTSFGAGVPLGGAAFYTEGGTPAVLNAAATVHDNELAAAGSYAGASLTLARHGGADAQDVFGASGNLGALTQGGNIVLSGVTIGTVTQNSGGTLLLTFGANATEARVNEAMRDITYANTSDILAASVRVDWSFSDGNTGAQGSGGTLAAAGSTTVNITAVNDAPVNTVPAAFSTPDSTDHAITGLSVSDPDSASLTTILFVDHGTLTVAAIGGATVKGSGTGSVTLTGSAAQIDAALGAPNNVIYHSVAGFHDTDVLTMLSSDGGPNISGTLLDIDTVAINVVSKSGFDFNGDNKSDILYFNDAGTTWVSQIDGVTPTVGGFGPALASGQHIAAVADFDGDHKVDVLLGSDNGTVTLDRMNGATAVSSAAVTSLAAGWHVETAADFNGDGKADILFSNDSGALWLSTMDGATITSGGIPGALSPGWHIGAVVDFDGDGKSDILYRNDNGQLWLNEMNGAAVKASAPLTMLAAGWHIATSGDFDGDGKADLLFRNDDGRVWLSELDGFNIKGGGLVTTTTPDWHIAAVGDYNGDGKSDLLWQNDSGLLWISQMNNAAVTAGGSPGQVDPGWHIAVHHFDLG